MPTNRPDTIYGTVHQFPRAAEAAHAEPSSADEPVEVEHSLDDESWRPSGLLEWFALAQTALPALLFIPGNQPLRFAIRASAFLISIAALCYWWAKGRPRVPVSHPAGRWLLIVCAILVVMLVHPDTPSLAAGVGQATLYLAVFAPLFWVPAFVTDRRTVMRVLAVLLVCNGVNSLVGVLQVYNPEQWMPSEFSSIYAMNRDLMGTAVYAGPNGRLIIRPPGLFDTPGAVCGAGTVAALLGVIFFLEKMQWWKRLAAIGFGGAGLAAIYLSHVRSSFAVTMVMLSVYVTLLVVQKQRARAVGFLGFAAVLVFGAMSLSIALGGAGVQERFLTFLQENPADLYFKSRGNQIQTAMTVLLSEYPAGAGLARWGVMSGYFGVPGSLRLGVDVQPLAWLYDGGLFLIAAYGIALVATVVWELKLVLRLPDPNDQLWAAAIVAANIGTLVLVFTFVPFATQIGTQFWFLEGLLHGAMTMKLREWQ